MLGVNTRKTGMSFETVFRRCFDRCYKTFRSVAMPIFRGSPTVIIYANEIQKHENPQNENRRKMPGRWCNDTHIEYKFKIPFVPRLLIDGDVPAEFLTVTLSPVRQCAATTNLQQITVM